MKNFTSFNKKTFKKMANTNDLVKKDTKNPAKLWLFANTEIVENTT